MPTFLLHVVLATVPAWLLVAVTWRLIWPRWKRWGKLALHPCLYLGLALLIGQWGVLAAWVHQGLGLAVHIWFSKNHGFTWYAVEDPERYIALSKATVASLGARRSRAGRVD